MKSLSHVRFLATPWIAAYQAPPSMGFFQTRVLELGAIAVSNFNYQIAKKKKSIIILASCIFDALSKIFSH